MGNSVVSVKNNPINFSCSKSDQHTVQTIFSSKRTEKFYNILTYVIPRKLTYVIPQKSDTSSYNDHYGIVLDEILISNIKPQDFLYAEIVTDGENLIVTTKIEEISPNKYKLKLESTQDIPSIPIGLAYYVDFRLFIYTKIQPSNDNILVDFNYEILDTDTIENYKKCPVDVIINEKIFRFFDGLITKIN